MGGFLRALALVAIAAGAVVWLRRSGFAQLIPDDDEAEALRQSDRRQMRELAEAVEQLRGELAAAKDTWRGDGQADERVDALWSERERNRELESRIAELEQARAADAAQAEAQAAQLERISATLDALGDEVAATRGQRQSDDVDRQDQIDALRSERSRAHLLEQQLTQAQGAEPTEPAWWDLDPPASFAELAEQVRHSLPGVALPDSALAGVIELDQSKSAGDWAAQAWHGLGALAQYASLASEPSDGRVSGLPEDWDFSQWCLVGGDSRAWPSERIGLDRQRRVFAVDRGVNWSGRIVARTHLLVGDPTDAAAPVIFVHDDARGRTGQMHVVFLGPQRQAAAVASV